MLVLELTPRRDIFRGMKGVDMEQSRFSELLLKAKEDKGLSFYNLGKLIGHSEMWMAALFYGQAQATAGEAKKIVSKLGLVREKKAVQSFLTAFPSKGLGPVVPLRDHAGVRVSLQGDRAGEIRRRHHERHRFHDGCRKRKRPQGRPRESDHVREIPALQGLVIPAGFHF
jgi:hypothetical protein